MHLLIFAGQEFSLALAIGVALYPAVADWIMGYLYEQVADAWTH